MSYRLVLASASPTRLRILEQAGLRPEVCPSDVDEDAVAAASTGELALELACRKARAVAGRISEGLVVGCDSLLDVDGESLGKPPTAADATRRWHQIRGRQGTLCTGYCVIDVTGDRQAQELVATTVRFGYPTDEEIDAYVASGEPMAVAGGFTLDGRGAAFVDGIDGDPANVLGLSPAVLRRLVGALGWTWTALWA